MFDILEAQRIVEGESRITILPPGSELLGKLAAVEERNAAVAPPPLRR
jgi:hypothetical protein